MKATHRSTPDRSRTSATQPKRLIAADQTSSRSPATHQKKKTQHPPQTNGPGDDALIRRDAQAFRDVTARMQHDGERAMRDTRTPRTTSPASTPSTRDSSAKTGVVYDDEAFWVIYQGQLIATVGSASEGYEILQRYGNRKHGGTTIRKKT